ncbi:hypothetical protein EDD85DRAFT_146585 [Armillaria nabsnona]|nr:hypothetical protein EDD85DRAFT_146585 [Armillaria nabsnona]
MHLFQTYSQFSIRSSKDVTATKSSEKPRENMASPSIFLPKKRWLPEAVQMFNTLCDERALYRVPLVLNKAFAPRTEAASMSDSRYVELASLEEVEKDLASQYGRLSGPYIDSVDVFQVVKDRAFNSKDKKSLEDLQKLDRLLKLRLELKTGASVSVHFLRSSIAFFHQKPQSSNRFHLSRVWTFLCNLSARCGVQCLFRNATKLPQ